MSSVPDEIQTALKPHVPEGETLRAVTVDESERSNRTKVTAVSDHRVIDMVNDTGGTTDETKINSYLLSDDRITGATYAKTQRTGLLNEWVGGAIIIIGMLVALAGVGPALSAGAGSASNPDWALLALGVLGVIAGTLIAALSSDAKEGVKIKVESTAREKSWHFSNDDEDVAQSISQVVSEQHR